MAISQPKVKLTFSRAEFESFIALPENEDRTWELIDGEAVEKMPSNPYSSWIAAQIVYALIQYLRDHGLKGFVTSEAAGYSVGGEVLAPDAAYTTEMLVEEGFQPNPPKLAVEVVSPTDKSADVRRKLLKYTAAGVIVWVIYPREQIVDVWSPNALPQSKGLEDMLTAPDLLPDFALPVRSIFQT